MLTLLIAVIIAVGGVRLAREQRVERVDRDRAEVKTFADAVQDELRRLEVAYEDHLKQLSTDDIWKSSIALKAEAGKIWGVRQVSVLRQIGRMELNVSVDDAAVFLPIPTFDEREVSTRRKVRLLDPDVVGVGFPGATGWVAASEGENGGKERLFWQIPYGGSDGERVIVVAIDEAEVAAKIDDWLREWLHVPFAGVRDGGGPDLLTGPHGDLVRAGEIPDSEADQVRSLPTRFGDWQLRSWDTRKQVVSYQSTVIKVALGLAFLVMAAGWFASFKLRQALRLAAQRVSFVNQVSHELRTPLTNILLNVDLAADSASPAGKRRLGLVRDEAGRLRRLIDNVLSFSTRRRRTAPSGALGTERCEVRQVIDNILSQYSTALRRKGIAVEAEIETDVCAAASADALAQIVGNLISNVEKYAADGGLLQVEALSEGEEVVVRVADHGPGIARSQRQRIFEAFQRLDDRVTEGSSGTGLGLSIARDLAEDFGGSLCLVDGKADGGVGAVFELRLALADEPIEIIDFPKTQAS